MLRRCIRSNVLLAIATCACVAFFVSTCHGGSPVPILDAHDDSDPCEMYSDTDGDTIADEHEGDEDSDGDTLPNHLDDDSDGDTLSDSIEAGDDDICTYPVSSDVVSERTTCIFNDMLPDYLDQDSDNDGLSDHDEHAIHCSDYRLPDSDEDGFADIVEVATGSSACDESDRPPGEPLVLELHFVDGDHDIAYLTIGFTGDETTDVRAHVVDEPDSSLEFDSTVFFKNIRPHTGTPDTPIGFDSLDETWFYSVAPGTALTLRIDAYNDIFSCENGTVLLGARIELHGPDSSVHGSRQVFIISPGGLDDTLHP